MGFSLKKLGRFIDPTSKSSPAGGVLRKGLDTLGTAFGVPPGAISAGLTGAGELGQMGKGAPGSPPPQVAPGAPPLASTPARWWVKFRDFMTKPAAIVGGLALAAALVFFLVFRRRR